MISAIIVAAGKGTRMGPDRDKLFLELCGRPVVAHTWQQFEVAPSIQEIVLVVRSGMEIDFRQLAERSGFKKCFRIVAGGRERQDSVWNGLQALSPGTEIVAIQDGARPCTSVDLIEATVRAAKKFGAAVAAERATDTIKESADGEFISGHLDRNRLWTVQTPQTFRVETIRRALAAVQEKNLSVTDDTAACALIGERVKLVSGFGPNPKVTQPGDLAFVEKLLEDEKR